MNEMNKVYVVIDDDSIFGRGFKKIIAREQPYSKVHYFESVASFFKDCDDIPKDSPIFLDHFINEEELGNEMAIKVYEKGFKNILICTSSLKSIKEKHSFVRGYFQGKSYLEYWNEINV